MSARSRYISKTVFLYLVFACGWILLSDQLLLLLFNPAQQLAASMAKGLLFVVLTGAGLWLALRAVPAGDDEPGLAEPRHFAGVLSYLLAFVLVMVMLIFRLFLPIEVAERPMMIIPILPVMLAAAVGGFGPGLLATVCAAAGIAYLSRAQLFGPEPSIYLQLQWLFFWLNGLMISWLCQLLHNNNRRAWQQQRLLDAVIDGTDDVIFIKDGQGRYQRVNRAFCQVLGKTPAQIIGKTDAQLVSKAQAEQWQQHDAQVRAAARLLHFQEQSVADGQLQLYSVSKGPLPDPLQPGALFGIARNITALVQQKQQLQRVLQGAEQGFWELDWPAQQLVVSEKFETMLGYQPGTLDARIANWPQLVHPADFPALMQSLQQHLHGHTSAHEAEFRMRCQDGSWRWILTRGKIVTVDSTGQPLLLAGTHSDISARRQAEHELRLAELMFAGSYDAIMLVDANKKILRVNPAFCRITGYSEQQMIGCSPAVLSSGLHDQHFYRQMWQQINEHDCWRGEIINKRRDGSLYSEMLSVSVVRDSQGQISQYVGIFTDISAQKAHAAELDKVANFDALTGLPNRRLLQTRFNQLLVNATQRNQRCAVCLLDLDNFKEINQQFGNAFGDKVLLSLSHNLQAVLRHDDTLARLGGDEFVILLADIPPLPEGNTVVKRLRSAVNKVLQIDQHQIQLTGSIGVSVYPDDNNDPDTLLRHADKAMFGAKERGRNRIQWFDPAHEQKAQEHRLLLDQVRDALDQQQFELFYQPKVDMQQGTVFGAEALIRWHHPERGLLSPAAFLPAIDGSELEQAVGDWVLEQALRQLAAWQAAGLQLSVAVNISASQLLAPSFRQQLAEGLARYPQLAAERLELEILESTAIRDLLAAREAIHSCQQLGVRFALDDFGTGYSSLTYLRQLPVHCLKIDQSFVRDMLDDPEDRNIVSGVVQLAQVFSRQVIAEGVESIAHARQLLGLGCYLLQGYGVARPMPASQLPSWLLQWQQQADWQALRQEIPPHQAAAASEFGT